VTAPITLPRLDLATLAELRQRYEETPNVESRTRYQMILLAQQKYKVPQIARMVLRSEDTVARVLNRFLAGGLDAVPRQVPPGRERRITAAWEAELLRIIELDPHEVGQDTANWTTQVLAEYLGQHTGIQVTEETVRVYLHAHDYGGLAPDVDPAAQSRRAGRLCGKRLRVEVLMAGATEPDPLPVKDLVEADLWSQLPADVPELLARLSRADLYLQDEVQFAFHPTLTRLWSLKGRRGQRFIEAPGDNRKAYGFGLVDWRDGWSDGRIATGRTADVFCDQVRAAVARSKARGRVAIIIADNLKTHTAKGSLLVRSMLTELVFSALSGLYACLRPGCQSH
jgi:transposase